MRKMASVTTHQFKKGPKSLFKPFIIKKMTYFHILLRDIKIIAMSIWHLFLRPHTHAHKYMLHWIMKT